MERPSKKRRLDTLNASIEFKRNSSKPLRPASQPKSSPTVNKKAIKAQTTSEGTPTTASPQRESRLSEAKALPHAINIVAGSYEKLLYGIRGTVIASDSHQSGFEIRLKPQFIFPAHVSCIKAVATSPSGGKWLATGSSDEIIKMWDLRKKKEIGGLMHHQGSVTYLSFPSASHLMSASEDGTLCLFRSRDWVVLRTLKGHKGPVNCVGVHPSGKIALSVGRDRTLRMWDLMRGKGSASTKLHKEAEVVRWSSDGSLFAVQSHSTIDIYTTDMTLVQSITHPSRIHEVAFCRCVDSEAEVMLVGAEDKKVTIYSVSSTKEVPLTVTGEMIGHTNRIKAIRTQSIALPESAPRKWTTLVCTVSSDGKIHVYDLADLPPMKRSDVPTSPASVTEITPIAQYDTKGTRLTCLAVAECDIAEHQDNDNEFDKKRKAAGSDSEEEEAGFESDGGAFDGTSEDENEDEA